MKYAREVLAAGFVLGLVLTGSARLPAQEISAGRGSAEDCGADEVLAPDYGISGFECNCSYTVLEGGRRYWRFRSELLIRGVKQRGVADGVLEAGDVITAIDGMLITTREAGERYANAKPGETVKFTVRRGSRVSEVELKVSGECERASVAPALAVEAAPVTEPEVAVAPVPRADVMMSAFPGGWFGFGISCDCVVKAGSGDEPSVWEFNEPPEIYSVEPGSPADRAGLRRGDLLLEIDGVELTSDDGGRRFGAVDPGQEVELTYRRGGATGSVRITAEKRQVGVVVAPPTPPEPELPPGPVSDQLRYAGTVGDVEVEVRGGNSVIVRVIEEGKEIEIVTAGARIRLRVRK